MSFDFNGAEKQRSGDLIPDNEICPVHMTVRPGGSGDGGWLKRNKDGNCLMLDCEFTVLEGPFTRRKFWTLLTVEGETEGQIKAVDITRSRLRAALESARGINPTDESDAAVAGRRVKGYGDFDGLRFVAVVGLEKGKDGYKDKNNLKAIVTPDRKDWTRLDQANKPKGAAASGPAQTAKPTQAVKPAASGKPNWANVA